jgi:hypothetical protein
VGHGRIKDQHSDPRPQEEVEDNYDHRTHQRGAGHEEITGKANYYTNTETGATGSNGTIARVGSRIPSTSRGIQGTYSTDLGRVCGIDQ